LNLLGDLSPHELRRSLLGTGVRLHAGPVVMSIRSPIPEVAAGLALHYAHHSLADAEAFADFHVGVARTNLLRNMWKPQVVFELDGERPFNPLPGDQGFPMLEWGMNWCLSGLCHQYLTLHAAVLERNGRAVILPAPSGSGKSTLCAALLFRGWRLLSDELAVIEIGRCQLVPVPRPVSLKNASIDLVRRFAPEAAFGPVVTETLKGDVAHFRPPADSVRRACELADPGWIVLPRYEAGAAAQLTPLGKGAALMRLIENAFNYNVHGRAGFELLARIVDRADCYTFTYSRLEDAAACFDRVASGDCSYADE
jgi:HprK-related kinase A